MDRKAAVAGMFYPDEPGELAGALSMLVEKTDKPEEVRGMIVPHAGYVYSGRCAGKAFGRVCFPDTVVVLGVNHRGGGPAFAVDDNDFWDTPLGKVGVDRELAGELVAGSPVFSLDSNAGLFEHSLEVQLPFIRHVNPDIQILPVTISWAKDGELLAAGREIAEKILVRRPGVTVVASTDMSHYISADRAREMDEKAISRIMDLDPAGMLQAVKQNRISMCGAAPTAVMLEAAIRSGASKAVNVEYTHSGLVTGDNREVVAYFSALII